MNSSQQYSRYVLVDGRISLRRCAPDSVVVYDDADASLRQLSKVATELLELLARGPSRVEQLATALLGDLPEPEDLALVERTLDDFAHLGWVRRAEA